MDVDALAACGMTGSATTLEVDASGETVLWRGAPLASALAPPAGAPGSASVLGLVVLVAKDGIVGME